MTDYIKQAEDFCKRNGVKVKISFDKKGLHFADDVKDRNIYKVCIKRNVKSYTFQFGDSIMNTERGIEPNVYDILACLQKYEVNYDIHDFADEYGYSIFNKDDLKKVKRIHRAVLREYQNVMRMFGDVIEELREIE